MSLSQGGFSPTAVDWETGLPETEDERLTRERGKKMLVALDTARNDAAEIMNALANPAIAPVIKGWIDQLVKRMEILMKKDDFCVAIMSGFAEMGFKLNWAEIFIEAEIRKVAGPNFPIPKMPG